MKDRAQHLQDLLQTSCTVNEMRQLVRHLPGGLELHLPEGSARPAEFAWELVQLLTRHNALDDQFFAAFIAERPRRRAEIAAVAAKYGVINLAHTMPLPTEVRTGTAESPPVMPQTQGSSKRTIVALGALGLVVVVPGLAASTLLQRDRSDSAAQAREPLVRDTSAHLPDLPVIIPSGTTGSFIDAKPVPLSHEPDVEPTRGPASDTSITATSASEDSMLAEPDSKLLQREACASLHRRTKAVMSTCADQEGLTTNEATVSISVSSSGEDITITPRDGARAQYLRCIENKIQLTAKAVGRAKVVPYECKLAPG